MQNGFNVIFFGSHSENRLFFAMIPEGRVKLT